MESRSPNRCVLVGEPVLSIRRLQAEYVFPASHPAPDAARSALDATLRRGMAAACARMFETLDRPDDPALWFIPALDLEISIPLEGAEDQLPRALARQFTQRLFEVLDRPGTGVRVFRDKAAYVACFLGDLLAGRALDAWFHAEFEGLRSLPASTAIVEALTREPALALPALRVLRREGELEHLLQTVSARGLERILGACARKQSGPDSASSSQVVDEILRTGGARNVEGDSPAAERAATALRILVAQGEDDAAMPGFFDSGGSASAPEAAPAAPPPFKPAAGSTEPGTAGQPPSPMPASRAPEVSASRGEAGTRGNRPAAATAAGSEATESQQHEAPGSAEFTLSSPRAGILLLVRSLAELGIDEAIERLPFASDEPQPGRAGTPLPPEPAAMRSALRAWIIAHAFGFGRDNSVLSDPVLLALAGATAPLTSETQLARVVESDAVRHLTRELRLTLVNTGQAKATGVLLRQVQLTPETPSILLAQDLPTGAWLGASIHADANAAGAARMLAEVMRDVTELRGRSPEFVVAPAPFDLGLDSSWRRTPPGFGLPALGADSALWTHRDLQALQADPAVLDALEAMASLRVHDTDPLLAVQQIGEGSDGPLTEFGLAIRLVASAVLRDLAQRLPGFARSSPTFLRTNVLAGPVTLQPVSTMGWRARFGPVPLQILLAMTGLDGTQFRLPWLRLRDTIEINLARS